MKRTINGYSIPWQPNFLMIKIILLHFAHKTQKGDFLGFVLFKLYSLSMEVC
jgi:hypothetical protein